MTRILIFSDSRWRDSFGHALVKYHLQSLLPDSEVQVISFNICIPIIELFKPDVVVLNHLNGKRNKQLASFVKRHDGYVVIMPPEGRPNTEKQLDWFVEQGNHSYCDLLLSWNDIVANRVKNAIVTGCPRFDIHQPPYNQSIQSRELFCARYNIDNSQPIIAFCSSFPQSKYHYKNKAFNRIDLKDLKVTTIAGFDNPDELAEREYQNLLTFQHWIRSVRYEYSDTYNYVIKPHPMEDITLWQRFCNENGILLIDGDYIFNVCNAAELVVSRAECLTHQDAWLCNKPSIHCMIGSGKGEGAGAEALQYGGRGIASSVSGLLGKIVEVETSPPSIEYLNKYGYTVPDSALKCAQAIANLVKNHKSNEIPYENRIELNRLLSKFDAENNNPTMDGLGHFGKTVTRKIVNDWIEKIRAI